VSKQEAEDILQDAFIKVWKNLNGFDTDLKLSSWLYRIVHNETISHWRKDKWANNNPFLELDERILDQLADDLGISEDCCPEIKEKIQLLSEKYREVLVLKYFEDMSYEDISDILKLPEGTVATRIKRAKIALSKILDNN
jgi:RNA polymerase sigma-70 factor (ECF subfamily)